MSDHLQKTSFVVEGMHCSSCAMAIEKALKRKEGIMDADLTFATEKLEVNYDEQKVTIPLLKKSLKKSDLKHI
jgi:Cu+-exporting ATPase